jgi:hypothetical protein
MSQSIPPPNLHLRARDSRLLFFAFRPSQVGCVHAVMAAWLVQALSLHSPSMIVHRVAGTHRGASVAVDDPPVLATLCGVGGLA